MAGNLPFEQIKWSERMATGIPVIDQQHHYLVDTLRRANRKLLGGQDDLALAETARDLLAYAIMHFETEEALMVQYGYHAARPDAARLHIDQHRDFSRRVVAIHEQLREKQAVSRVEVLAFLNHWLRDHVLGVDQALATFLNEAMARAAGTPNG
jgi:hemerythrin